MGSPKALLPWGETSLLDFAVQQARLAEIEAIVVVLGPATRHIESNLTEVRVAMNPEPETGRSASIRLGCSALPDDLAAVLVQSVDQPTPSHVLKALFDALDRPTSFPDLGQAPGATAGRHEADIAIPTFGGRRGHPVAFAGRLLPELRALTEAGQGLRSVVRRHADALVEVEVETEAVLWNLNDPAAYAAALAKLVQP
jgi:molybdenum cofactor cytidylyltransferase